MITCDRIAYRADAEGGPGRPILHELSFSVRDGSITLVRGPSGAGKSTLLAILACVRRPTSGEVTLDGRPVSRFTAHHRDQVRRLIGFVPQDLHLFDELTALENTVVPLLPLGIAPRNATSRAASVLDALELDPSSTRSVRAMSGGERQRVAIARALVIEPRVLVLDEPTAHQDDERTASVLRLVQEAAQRETSVIVAAHDTRLDAWDAVAQSLRLEAGQLSGEAR